MRPHRIARLLALAHGGVALGAVVLGACTGGDRPSLDPASAAPEVGPMVTRAPDQGTGSQTTVPGESPFARDSGVRADVDAPCDLLSTEVLATLDIDAARAQPRSGDPGRCLVEAADGTIEVTVSPFSAAGRQAAFEEYNDHRKTLIDANPGAEIPATYYQGDTAGDAPEIALFPDNATVVLTLPHTAAAELSESEVAAVVSAVEQAMRK